MKQIKNVPNHQPDCVCSYPFLSPNKGKPLSDEPHDISRDSGRLEKIERWYGSWQLPWVGKAMDHGDGDTEEVPYHTVPQLLKTASNLDATEKKRLNCSGMRQRPGPMWPRYKQMVSKFTIKKNDSIETHRMWPANIWDQ